jgi:hypothetical protein
VLAALGWALAGLLAGGAATAAESAEQPSDSRPAATQIAPAPESSLREEIGAPPVEVASRRPSVPAYIEAAPEPAPRLPDVSARPANHNADRFGTAPIDSDDFDYASLPGRLAEPSLRELWREGLDFERRGVLLESTRRYELIVGEVPEESYTYWRIARNYWRYGESLPLDEKLERTRYFELAQSWSGRGISIDPDCAPCMLWKFVSMGRKATTNGLWSAAGDVDEMSDLLSRGIALRPEHADDEGNATLGNLYYAGAVFYRVIPDWFWLRWLVGVRGDKELSLEYAREAVEISKVRVDYRVELGAVLLCLGTDKERPEAVAEGMRVLRSAQQLDDYLPTDHLDKSHAAVLVDSPEKACGYSRDGFIDFDEVLEESNVKR